MPVVVIFQSPRDLPLKQQAAAGITKSLVESYGLTPDQVQVYFNEFPSSNWAKAGVLAAETAEAAAGDA
jgi:phenylpyruvate tautomerase PptA (4-oxalocrotonate tautomerase family)